MANEETIRVALVEDDRGLREGLGMLLAGTPGFALAGAWPRAEDALPELGRARAQVLLLDIHLKGGMLGTEAVAHLVERHPDLAVVMLTVASDDERIFEALCRGARGYLLKKTPPARLLEAVRDAHAGGAPMSPEIAAKVIRLFRQVQPPPANEFNLTPQELRLLALLAEGRSYQTAADELIVSINTVRNYIRSIYDKLHVHSKSAAVSKALKAGLL